jgi:hypothetical protein
MPKRSRKPPTDPNKAAVAILQQATEKPETPKPRKKNRAAVALGRLGGKKGGPARAKSLSSAQRKKIARNAALARWKKSPPDL